MGPAKGYSWNTLFRTGSPILFMTGIMNPQSEWGTQRRYVMVIYAWLLELSGTTLHACFLLPHHIISKMCISDESYERFFCDICKAYVDICQLADKLDIKWGCCHIWLPCCDEWLDFSTVNQALSIITAFRGRYSKLDTFIESYDQLCEC